MNQSRKELLAYELASTLKDKNIGLFLSYTEVCPEEVLREKLAYVMAKQDHEITNNRAALFVHLVKQYVKSNRNYHRY